MEGWQSVAATPAAYTVRHLGVVAIGLVGTTAAATTSRLLLGSWRWALVTAAALLALPMWEGHLMFNIKDVPVATGYTLVTLALIAMVPPSRCRAAVRVLTLFAGIVLMVGTRPAMASAVLGSAAFVLAGVAITHRRLERRLAGCDVVTVQRSLGHSTPSITLDTYAHLWSTAEDRTRAAAAGLMDVAFSGRDQ